MEIIPTAYHYWNKVLLLIIITKSIFELNLRDSKKKKNRDRLGQNRIYFVECIKKVDGKEIGGSSLVSFDTENATPNQKRRNSPFK
jgi:hypothetical protein